MTGCGRDWSGRPHYSLSVLHLPRGMKQGSSRGVALVQGGAGSRRWNSPRGDGLARAEAEKAQVMEEFAGLAMTPGRLGSSTSRCQVERLPGRFLRPSRDLPGHAMSDRTLRTPCRASRPGPASGSRRLPADQGGARREKLPNRWRGERERDRQDGHRQRGGVSTNFPRRKSGPALPQCPIVCILSFGFPGLKSRAPRLVSGAAQYVKMLRNARANLPVYAFHRGHCRDGTHLFFFWGASGTKRHYSAS